MMKSKKLTATAVAAGLMLAVVGPAFAAPNKNAANNDHAANDAAAVKRMKDLGIVKGDERGNLKLDSTITRAELVTTIVRSFGREQSAVAKHGRPSFGDIKPSEWHSGWIAEAKALAAERGVTLGTTASTFNPGGKVSQIEALVFIMKFMGAVPTNTAGATWYDAWLTEAVNRGLITEAVAAEVKATAGQMATRGEAFAVLDAGYSAKNPAGDSLYNLFVDPAKPELVLTVPATTTEATITLAGTVSDNKGVESVTVNDLAVTVASGAFTHEVALAVGVNEITVVVTDLAGNITKETYVIERTEAPVDETTPVDQTTPADQTGTTDGSGTVSIMV